MGQNRRYPGKMDPFIGEFVISPRPVTLSPAELDLEHQEVTRPDTPVPVIAWVRFPEVVIRPQALAVEWTATAVRVEWTGARARGRVPGRPVALSDAQRAAVVEMRAAGRTAAEVAELFGVSERTVRRVAAT